VRVDDSVGAETGFAWHYSICGVCARSDRDGWRPGAPVRPDQRPAPAAVGDPAPGRWMVAGQPPLGTAIVLVLGLLSSSTQPEQGLPVQGAPSRRQIDRPARTSSSSKPLCDEVVDEVGVVELGPAGAGVAAADDAGAVGALDRPVLVQLEEVPAPFVIWMVLGCCRVGTRPLDEIAASDIETLQRQTAGRARYRRTSRGGRHAGEHVVLRPVRCTRERSPTG
jgi:hypothetical protein